MSLSEHVHAIARKVYPASGMALDLLAVERLHLASRQISIDRVEWYDLEGKLCGISRALQFPPAFSSRLDLVVQLIGDRAWSCTNYHEERCQLRRELFGLDRAYHAQVGMFKADAATDGAAALTALLRQVDYESSTAALFTETTPHAR